MKRYKSICAMSACAVLLLCGVVWALSNAMQALVGQVVSGGGTGITHISDASTEQTHWDGSTSITVPSGATYAVISAMDVSTYGTVTFNSTSASRVGTTSFYTVSVSGSGSQTLAWSGFSTSGATVAWIVSFFSGVSGIRSSANLASSGAGPEFVSTGDMSCQTGDYAIANGSGLTTSYADTDSGEQTSLKTQTCQGSSPGDVTASVFTKTISGSTVSLRVYVSWGNISGLVLNP